MPMGIVSPKDFEKELTNVSGSRDVKIPSISIEDNDGPSITGTVQRIERGRTEGAIEVPNAIRNLIGDESVTNGRQSALQLAQEFGISPSSVSAYANGATSTSTYNDKPNAKVITSARMRVTKRATSKLMKALNGITEDTLEGLPAKDCAAIAKDMSAIIKNMESKDSGSEGPVHNGPTFVFYKPQMRTEESYEVVHARE